jgi:hypothetical protein
MSLDAFQDDEQMKHPYGLSRDLDCPLTPVKHIRLPASGLAQADLTEFMTAWASPDLHSKL